MKTVLLATLLVASLALAGCASNNAASPSPSASTVSLLESGSTFVLPLAQKWATAYDAAHGGVAISVNGGGSGKGKTDITQKLVDLAGSDSTMNDSAVQAAGGDILQLPVAAGAVTLAYNVPELGSAPLKLDGATIARIYLGQVTRWNDPALAALNPGASLPAQDIAVVHRSDGSGTTATFTDYLSKVSPDWKAQVGSGTSVSWPCEKATPACTGASGNNGVGGQVQSIPYSFAYLGAEWANISKVQTALVQNHAGNFEAPTPDTVGAAVAAGVASGAFDAKLRGSVTDMGCATCYPITLVSWFLVHQHQSDAAKEQALASFLRYVVHDGQSLNAAASYVAVPGELVAKEDQLLATMDVK
jgi:phosphate transport system substrate-binding protein